MIKVPFWRRKKSASSDEPAWIRIHAPFSGKTVPLTEVPDPVFARKMVGDGVAILPESDLLLSPVGGTLTHLFPTGHAAGITTDEGLEILVHIGINTVELKGDGFTVLATPENGWRRGNRSSGSIWRSFKGRPNRWCHRWW